MKVRQEVVVKSHNYDEDDEAGLESAALGIDEPPGADAPPGLDPSVGLVTLNMAYDVGV